MTFVQQNWSLCHFALYLLLAETERNVRIASIIIKIFPECVGLTAEYYCCCIPYLLSTK